jgi:hypothetical protein
VHPLGDRARAHGGVEDVDQVADLDARLLLRLAADRGLGVVLVEQARGGLDQHAVGMVVHVGGEPELPGEEDRAPTRVEQEDRRPVAAVVRLTLLGGPPSVATLDVEGAAAEHVPAVRGHLDVTDDDVGVAGQIPARQVETRPSASVGGTRATRVHHPTRMTEGDDGRW